MISWIKAQPVFSAVILCLLVVTIQKPYNNSPPIRSDGVGYHLWTRALLTGDFAFCSFVDLDDYDQKMAVSHIDPARGVCQIKYPAGLALLRLPLMAPFVDLKSPKFRIEYSEHRVSLYLAALALIGIWMLLARTMGELGVSAPTRELVLLGGFLGTGLFHYGTYDNSFTHVYSALGVAVLLWAFCTTRDRRVIPTWMLASTFFAAFFLGLLRTTNVLGLVISSTLALGFWHSHRSRRTLVGLVSIGSLVGLTLQLIYNRYASGDWTLSSYGTESFVWQRPMALSVLASFERGLFVYYPFFGVALGLGLYNKRTRGIAVGLSVLTLAYAVVYGFWHSWFLGGGFGHRGFIEWVPCAVVLAGLSLRGVAWRFAHASVLVSAGVGLILLSGYWAGTLDFMGTTSHRFFEQFTVARIAVAVLATSAAWFGLTFRETRESSE